MVKDSIANLISNLKNANKAGHETATFPYSAMNLSILEILAKNGMVGAVARKGKMGPHLIEAGLVYEGKLPKIQDVKRISTFSKRIYKGAKELKPVKSGFGLSVVSTSKGIMTDSEARKAKLGGEVLFSIW